MTHQQFKLLFAVGVAALVGGLVGMGVVVFSLFAFGWPEKDDPGKKMDAPYIADPKKE
jgi:hypothetical protein